MADRRFDQRENRQRNKGADGQSTRRIKIDLTDAAYMGPKEKHQHHRQTQKMQKGHQGEKAVGNLPFKKVEHHGSGNHR